MTMGSPKKGGEKAEKGEGIWVIDVTQKSHPNEIARNFSLQIHLYETILDRTFLTFLSELLAQIVSTNFPYYLGWNVVHMVGKHSCT